MQDSFESIIVRMSMLELWIRSTLQELVVTGNFCPTSSVEFVLNWGEKCVVQDFKNQCTATSEAGTN